MARVGGFYFSQQTFPQPKTWWPETSFFPAWISEQRFLEPFSQREAVVSGSGFMQESQVQLCILSKHEGTSTVPIQVLQSWAPVLNFRPDTRPHHTHTHFGIKSQLISPGFYFLFILTPDQHTLLSFIFQFSFSRLSTCLQPAENMLAQSITLIEFLTF